jgi:hypothetical protein
MSGAVLTSAAADRNKGPILTVLEAELREAASVLEIASGTGQHVCFFAAALPGIRWQPTDPDAASREAISVRIREAALANVEPPVALDVLQPVWPVADRYDAVLCINMIHISPWSTTDALCRGAAARLRARGKLVLYGPFLENGTAVQSNLDFDDSLKRRDPEWGLRDIADVTRVANEHGLLRQRIVRLPANNLAVVFAKPE